MMFWLTAISFAFLVEKKPGVCRAVRAPPRSVLAVSRVVADRLTAVERVGVWQMEGHVRSGMATVIASWPRASLLALGSLSSFLEPQR
jgi:hypothetical protein